MRLRYLFIILAVLQLLPWVVLYFHGIDLGSALFYLTEGMTLLNCVALWFFYRKVLRPIDALSGGLDMLRAQDLNSSLRKVGQPEVDKIADIFNEILVKLKKQRIRYEERTHFLNLLIEAAPVGVIIMDFNGSEEMRNPAAKRMEISLSDLSPLGVGASREIRNSSGRIIQASCHSFIDRGVEHRFYIIADISTPVSAAEKEAYGKIIRMMAHEVNNTMAGFSSALMIAIPEIHDKDVREVLEACWKRSGELSAFISRFADVVRLPAPKLREVSLREMVADSRPFLESLSVSKGISMEFAGVDDGASQDNAGDSIVAVDPELMVQVLVNIIKNAVESIISAGRPDGRIILSVAGRTLTVTDNGGGIDAEKGSRLFTPFFTDKPSGQGIGLMVIKEILSSHRATFSLSTSPDDNLTRFRIKFPSI